MTRKIRSILVLGLFAVFVNRAFMAQTGGLMSREGYASKNVASKQILEAYGRLPLSFEENRGQADARIKFLSRGANHTLFLAPDELILGIAQSQPQSGAKAALFSKRPALSAVMRMKFLGANPVAEMDGQETLPGKSNYFIGSDSSNWHTNLATYAEVRSRQLYPGIDLIYYGNQSELEFDLVVAPGADVRNIRLSAPCSLQFSKP